MVADVVGRITELAALREALDDARAGRPGLVTLVGPAGIGKTTLLGWLGEAARATGARVLHGAALEGSEVPYLPVVSALRDVPAASAAFDDASGGGADDLTAERGHALYRDVTKAIADLARLRPVVLVVDDVQWADPATIDLLSHVAVSLLLTPGGDRCGLLLVVATRPVEEGRVGRLIGRLGRHPRGRELRLGPLAPQETHALVERLAGASPAPALSARLQEASGGNPLVLGGLVRRHVDDGSIRRRGGRLRLAEGRDLGPGRTDLDLDAELRLGALPEDGGPVLELAALVGSNPSVPVLDRVAGSLGVATPIAGPLAAAEVAGIVRPDGPERVAFVLDEVRRVLAARAATRWGAAAHDAVAAALAEASGTEPVDPAEVLRHLVRGAEPAPDAVARWARRAGDDAYALAAWHQALEAYELVLGAGHESDVDLRFRTGLAARFASDSDAAHRHLREATSLASAIGDQERRAAAVVARVRTSFIDGRGGEGLAEELEELAAGGAPVVRTRALAAAADLAYARGDMDAAMDLGGRATAEARRAEDDQVLAEAHTSLGVALLGVLDVLGAQRELADGAAAAGRSGDRHLRSSAESRGQLAAFIAGRLDDVLEQGFEVVEEMEAYGYWSDSQVARCAIHATAVVSGRLREAEHLAATTALLADWNPYAYTVGLLLPAAAAARAMRGDADGAARAVAELVERGGRGGWRVGQATRVLLGRSEEVRDEVASRGWRSPAGPADLLSLPAIAMQVEVGAATGVPEGLEVAVDALGRALDGGVVFVPGWPAGAARLVGQGLAALGKADEAVAWLRLGVDRSAAVGARAEEARSLLELGLVEQRLGAASAPASLAEAALLLDEVGMLPLAATARRAASARGAPAPARRTRRVVFCSDLVGSTSMNVRLGDDAWAELVGEHDRMIRRCFRTHDGVEFKHTGDGFFAWFATADDAVGCAFDVHDALERWNVVHPDRALAARIGLAEGMPVDVGDDLFGIAVVEAARLCAQARTGGILVTDDVAAWCGEQVVLVDAGQRVLKGIPEARATFEPVRVSGK